MHGQNENENGQKMTSPFNYQRFQMVPINFIIIIFSRNLHSITADRWHPHKPIRLLVRFTSQASSLADCDTLSQQLILLTLDISLYKWIIHKSIHIRKNDPLPNHQYIIILYHFLCWVLPNSMHKVLFQGWTDHLRTASLRDMLQKATFNVIVNDELRKQKSGVQIFHLGIISSTHNSYQRCNSYRYKFNKFASDKNGQHNAEVNSIHMSL